MYKVNCSRCCSKEGIIPHFKHVQSGVCFKCKGKGFVLLKTKPRKPSKKWLVGAVSKKSKEDTYPICSVVAVTEEEALDTAQQQLRGGSGYRPNTIYVRPYAPYDAIDNFDYENQ